MKFKYRKVLAGIFFLCYLYSCGSKSNDPSAAVKGVNNPRANSPLAVEGYLVQSSVLNSSIDVAGTLLPFEETEIHPEVSGKVVMLSIEEGAFVRRGKLLARLFDGDLRAQLHKLNVQLAIAKKTQDRQSELLKIGGISQQDYDLSLLSVSTIQADMQVLNASINKTIIRAPFDGKIGFKNISIGAYITPVTIITTIRQISKLKLEFSVPEKYTSNIKLGNFISFTSESSSKKYNAKIVATESGITEESRSLKAHAIVENTDENITAGSFATVNFSMGDNNNAIMIPTQAIIPEARDKKVIVYRSGIAIFNTVITGDRDSARVEIVKGLAVGDTIITTGLLTIKPASKIKLSSLKK
ncbi:MAG: efflux RND transporter periplasmic adaptor subunit [Ginsengibacter sp.]